MVTRWVSDMYDGHISAAIIETPTSYHIIVHFDVIVLNAVSISIFSVIFSIGEDVAIFGFSWNDGFLSLNKQYFKFLT